jgi:hypothetical protein
MLPKTIAIHGNLHWVPPINASSNNLKKYFERPAFWRDVFFVEIDVAPLPCRTASACGKAGGLF